MIKAIYGNPNSSSINFSALSPDSVYNMYGNINREDIEEYYLSGKYGAKPIFQDFNFPFSFWED